MTDASARFARLPEGVISGGSSTPYRSYDHAGRAFCWEPAPAEGCARFAFDIEAKDCAGGDNVRAAFGLDRETFLKCWTATEVAAKLLDRPIHLFIKETGLFKPTPAWRPLRSLRIVRPRAATDRDAPSPPENIWIRSVELADHFAAVGFRTRG